MSDKLITNIADTCRKVILEDGEIKEIDTTFYDLLDCVDNEIAAKLEEAYLEYGTRVAQLAYEQGLKDAKE